MKTAALSKCLFMFLLMNCCKGNIYCQPLLIKEESVIMDCCTGFSIDIKFQVDPLLWKSNQIKLDTVWGHGNLFLISRENIEQVNDSILIVHCPFIFEVGAAYVPHVPEDDKNSLIYHIKGTRHEYAFSPGKLWWGR